MTLADVASYADLMEELRGTLEAAGLLAGSLRYPVAGAADDALWDLAGRQGWTRELLDDALYGIADEERVNEQVLDFDRSQLRGRWCLGWSDGTAALWSLALPERECSAPRCALPWTSAHGASSVSRTTRGKAHARRIRRGA